MTVLNSFLSTPNVSSTDRIDFMEHSNSSDCWDWIYTNDFKFNQNVHKKKCITNLFDILYSE